MAKPRNQNDQVDEQDILVTSSASKITPDDPKIEPKTEEDDKKIQFPSGPASAEPAHSMAQWREVLLEQPEWPLLPSDIQAAIELRLKDTTFPSEPSGHSTWKRAKAALRQGSVPKTVDLITATFVWRAKQKRKVPTLVTTALPDSFVADADFHVPPIDIRSWPRREGVVAPWVGVEVKVKEGASGPSNPRIPASGVGGAREVTAAPAFQQGAPAGASPDRPTPRTRKPGQKRGRTADVDDPTVTGPPKRSKKSSTTSTTARTGTPSTTSHHQQQPITPTELSTWRNKLEASAIHLAAADAKIASLALEAAETRKELADAGDRLREATDRLHEMETELGEVRSIAMNNRRNIRRVVGGVGEAIGPQLQALGKLARELKKVEDNMG
jgi:hypothetical protein